jgi:hypothetical protein
LKGDWRGRAKYSFFHLHQGVFLSIFVSSNEGHDIMINDIENKQARISAIREQIAGIPAMLDGSLMTKHNRVKRKDGSIHVSPEYYTFQYSGADGKRKWKRISHKAKPAVVRLVRAAQRYRSLEREYTALVTELSLIDDVKKTTEPASAATCFREHRGRPTRPRNRRDGRGRVSRRAQGSRQTVRGRCSS